MKAPVVYRLFDEAGTLLYVGLTDDLKLRLDHHRNTKPWWEQVARVDAVLYAVRRAAAEAETIAIRTENPVHGQLDRSAVSRRGWLTRRAIYGPTGHVGVPRHINHKGVAS